MNFIRSLIATCIGIYWSTLGSFCVAVEIQFVTHNGASVIHQLSRDRIFLSTIENIYFKQYTHADALLALENEDTKVEMHQLFSELLKETQESSFAPVLSNIADPALQQQVIAYVQQAFHKKANAPSKLLVEDYIADANRWCECHTTSAYLDLLVTLYGQTHLEGAACIYVYPFLTDQPDAEIQVFDQHILLPIQKEYTIEKDFGLLLYRLCQTWYGQQGAAIQQAVLRFFNHYPSPYAYFVGEYFPSLCAYTCVSLYRSHHPSMHPINANLPLAMPMRQLGEAMTKELQPYLAQGKRFDKKFFKAAVVHFQNLFPNVKNEVKTVLQRCTLYSESAHRDAISTLLHDLCNTHSRFYLNFDQETHISDFFDINSPVIFIANQKTFATDIYTKSPWLKHLKPLPRAQMAQKNGLYYLRGKNDRMY